MNRIQRQDSSSVRMPPSRAPAAPPAPATALHMPMARARACGSRKVVVRIVSVAGDKMAPPSPCAARAAISMAWSCARPPNRLATVNTPRPSEEDAPAAEQVGGAPTEQEETGEGERVSVQHPLQLCLGEPEAVLDGRQRHVHDRDVEDDHELGDTRQAEHEPVRRPGGRVPFAVMSGARSTSCVSPDVAEFFPGG